MAYEEKAAYPKVKPLRAPARELEMPANPEAERALLGAMLIDSTAMPVIASILTPDDFDIEAHRLMYQAALDVYSGGDPVDLITLMEQLRLHNQLEEIGGISAISSLTNTVPSSLNIVAYARIVAQTADQRRLIHLWQRHSLLGYDGQVLPLDAITQVQEGLTTVSERIIGRTNEQGKAIFTGVELMQMDMPDPHLIIAGIIPEGLTVLGGRPKMGKSWLSLNLAHAVASGGAALGYTSTEQGDVLYLALEDRPMRLRERLQQTLGDTPPSPALHFAVDCPRLDVGGLLLIEKWIREHANARMVIIDTLAKFQPESSDGNNINLYAQDYATMSALKKIADKHHIGVVVVHHLRKSGSIADDPLEELSGTNGISGAADAILILKRPRNQDDGTLTIVGRDIEENELALRFDRTTGHWSVIGQSADVQANGTQKAIKEAIKDAGCPLTHKEIVEITGLKSNTVKVTLWRMVKSGVLVTDQHAKYSIAVA